MISAPSRSALVTWGDCLTCSARTIWCVGMKPNILPYQSTPDRAPFFNDTKKSVTNTSAPPCNMYYDDDDKVRQEEEKNWSLSIIVSVTNSFLLSRGNRAIKPFVGCVGIGESIFPTTRLCVGADEAEQKINARKVLEHNHLTGFCFLRKAFVWQMERVVWTHNWSLLIKHFFIIWGHKSPLKVYEMFIIDGAFVQASGWDQTRKVTRNQNTRDLFLWQMKPLRNFTEPSMADV